MEVHDHDANEPVSGLMTMADSLPGLGIVAAVLGRTCPGTIRRPISTAMIGATPFRKAIMVTRNTCMNACSSSAILPMRAASGPTSP